MGAVDRSGARAGTKEAGMKTIRVAGRVVIVHRVHDGGYWAQVKDAPGCIAVGRTMAELRGNM